MSAFTTNRAMPLTRAGRAGRSPDRPWRTCLILALACTCVAAANPRERPRTGDIVFQTSESQQSRAIQAATHSPFSHMGLVLYREGRPYVLEAVAQVRLTPLTEWVRRGRDGRYVVKRLKDGGYLAGQTSVERLERAALRFRGRPYDAYFEWSDERIYCSELVWKAFQRGLGLRIGEPAALSTFDLSSEVVQQKLRERFGDRVPLQEPVISPAAIFNSPLLKSVP
jgi:hypothetical protein